MILFVFTCRTEALEGKDEQHWQESPHQIRIHDCNIPVSLRKYVIPADCMMTSSKIPMKNLKERISGTIVVEEQIQAISGAVCVATKSQFRGYCGAYSHWKFMSVPEIEVGINVSPQICQKALREKQFMAPDGKMLSVDLDEELLYQYVEDGSITVQESNTYCTGVRLKLHSQLADESLVLTQIRFTIKRERFLEDKDGRISAEFKRVQLPKECEVRFSACQVDNTAFLFEEEPNRCPFRMVRGITVHHEQESLIIDRDLGLLFNLTMPKRINMPGCPQFNMYGTTIQDLYISIDPQARMLPQIDVLNIKEDKDLLPNLAYISHHHAEQINKLRRSQQEGSCQAWLSIGNDKDYHHPINRESGVFVRRSGRVIFEYECLKLEVPLAELDHCTRATPVVVRGRVLYADPDTLVVYPNPEIVPCHQNFPMLVETTKNIWVAVSKKIVQVQSPRKLSDKFEETKEDRVTQLYTPEELENWEDFKNFPRYMKSTQQKIMNSFCVKEACALESQNLLGKIYNLDGLVENAESRGAELLESLNPLGFVTKEITIIKDFILLCLVVEYSMLGISSIVAIAIFGLTATLAAIINRLTLDWSKLKSRKNPRTAAVRMGGTTSE